MPNGTRSKTTTGALITDAVVRPVQPGDEAGWRRLYAGYADFYRVEMNDSILASTWSWLLNEDHPLEGLIAVSNDVPVGLAHYRAQPKPLLGRDAGFLDDLFVDPASRGAGVARLLVRRVAAIARKRGWSSVRWITAEDNEAARRLYDRIAFATSWVTYELKP